MEDHYCSEKDPIEQNVTCRDEILELFEILVLYYYYPPYQPEVGRAEDEYYCYYHVVHHVPDQLLVCIWSLAEVYVIVY